MVKVSYADMPQKLKEREEFTGFSFCVGSECDDYTGAVLHTYKDNEIYVVYSYATQILKINLKDNTGIYNGTRYSSTTRKLQNILETEILPNLKHIKYLNNLDYGVIL